MMTEYVTNQGYDLLSRMLSGQCSINFTRVEMGNGTQTETDLKKVTRLVNTVCSVNVESTKVESDNTVDVTATFTNTQIDSAFYFKEKGVFASDGNKEILFSYAYTRDPELIPKNSEQFMEKRLKSIMKQLQSTTGAINIQVKSGIYVPNEEYVKNKEEIDEAIKSLENPTYDIKEQTEVEELKSGESLKIALRKLAKAVADYIIHKADVVAHITAEERTAWNAKLGAEKIAANLTTTEDGMVLAAAMGKVLKEQIDTNADAISTLNSNIKRNIVNKYFVTHNIATSGTQTSNINLENGSYLISQNHPTAIPSLYHVSCMKGYAGKVAPIIEDPNCTININTKLELTITTNTGGGNFRWYHIIKIADLEGLEL